MKIAFNILVAIGSITEKVAPIIIGAVFILVGLAVATAVISNG